MSYYYGWHPYVPVKERKRQAERKLAALKKQGRSVSPVRIEGRAIAKSFWGKAWCANLERYSDYENRLPRGRTYVRNGSVVDLQIGKGKVTAMVAGSSLYKIKIDIAPVGADRWQGICRDCAGRVDSLVELLQGRLAKSVMDRVCREGDGLFPSPQDIRLSCSCPDWAEMCKHVAAVLYGIGARLDEEPALLFLLREVDENELLAGAAGHFPLPKAAQGASNVLDDKDVAALFGLEMTDTADAGTESRPIPKQRAPHKPPRGGTSARTKATPPRKKHRSPNRTLPKSRKRTPRPRDTA